MIAVTSLASFAVVALVNCGAPNAPAPAEVDQVCRASCVAQKSCKADLDESRCERRCMTRDSGVRQAWREDYERSVVSCLGSASCEVIGNPKARHQACFEADRPSPTEEAQHFCEVLIAKNLSCSALGGGEPRAGISTEACLARYGVMDDVTLEKLISCQQRGCGKPGALAPRLTRGDCLESTIGPL